MNEKAIIAQTIRVAVLESFFMCLPPRLYFAVQPPDLHRASAKKSPLIKKDKSSENVAP
jgi:hypothetical protein